MSQIEDLDDFTLANLEQRLGDFDGVERFGYVTAVTGTIVRAAVPGVRIGEICRIDRPGMADLSAEVVGFDRQDVLLMPLGRLEAIAIKAGVRPSGEDPWVPAGMAVRGRVLDAIGRPIDGKGPLVDPLRSPLIVPPPNPLLRKRIREPLSTGVKAIDAMLTLGRGQ